MDVRGISIAVLLVAALAGITWVLVDQGPLPLTPLPASSAEQPVQVSTSDARAALLGLRPASRSSLRADPDRSRADPDRQEHNRRVAAWATALDALAKGHKSQREVERLEMDVWLQRHRIGEASAQALHTRLATLVARELERRERMHKAAFAGDDEVRQARVILARERHAAGDPDSGYASLQTAYVSERTKHFERMGRMKVMDPQVTRVEIDMVLREFPLPDAVRPASAATP